MAFVAERCADQTPARMLEAPKATRDAWLVGRNGVDVVEEFAVRADPAEWQEVLVRLAPRSYSISSSPLVSPHEVQLTVSVVRYRSVRGAQRGGVCVDLPGRSGVARRTVFLQPSPHFRPPRGRSRPR